MSNNSHLKSLKTRLATNFSIFVAVGLVSLTAITTFINARDLTRHEKTEHLSIELAQNLGSLEHHIVFLEKFLKQFAREHFVINSLIDPQGRALYLPNLIKDFSGIEHVVAVTIVDIEGEPIHSSHKKPPAYRATIDLRAALNLGEIILKISEDRKHIVMVEPINYYETPQGAVIVEWDLAGIITHSLFFKPSYFHRLDYAGSPLFLHNFDEHTSYIAARKTPGAKFPTLNRLGIGMELGVSRVEFLKPIISIAVQQLLLGCGFVVIAIILAVRLGSSISRPILQLCEKVGQLDLSKNQRCSPVGTGDELEELARAFDTRTEQLTSIQTNLETSADALRSSNTQLQLLASVFENAHEGIVLLTPEKTIQRVNPAFCTITGYNAEEVIGRSSSVFNGTLNDEQMWNALQKNGFWNGETWQRRKTGETFPAWHSVKEVRDAEGSITHYVAVFHDTSDIKNSEKRLEHQAFHDTLTELPNRQLFYDRLGKALSIAQRRGHMLAILFLDLDNFKNINDSLGHHVGDLFLQEVAKRLKECCREADTVARLGGDEFIILVDINDTQNAIVLARKIIASFSVPISLKGHLLYGSTSIGITYFPLDGNTAESLVQNADMAMYRAKQEGKNRFQLFTESMNLKASRRLTIENNLRRALEKDEFLIYYQPKVCLSTATMIGTEALIRWQQPDGTLISPAEFIPIAEETGLIIPIGEYVLRTACRQAKSWHEAGFPLSVAVNLSASQFREKNLAETVDSILRETGLPADALELEITEGVVMDNRENAIDILQNLKQMKIRISIDDFGTGYSSLSYLKQLPIDTLKVDIAFIRDLPYNLDDVAITSAIIAMAKSLNLKVIAEGVERTEQLTFLKEHDCDQIQGYLFSPPVTGDQLWKMLWEDNNLDFNALGV